MEETFVGVSLDAVYKNVRTYMDQSRSLIRDLQAQLERKKTFVNDDDIDNEEEIRAAADMRNTLARLNTVNGCIEESAMLLTTCSNLTQARINELEAKYNCMEYTIEAQKQRITVLSAEKAAERWSDTNPNLISLRRSHDARLDYVTRLTRQLRDEKALTESLLRKEDDLRQSWLAMVNNHAIEEQCLREQLHIERDITRAHAAHITQLKQKLADEREQNRRLQKAKNSSAIQKGSLKWLRKRFNTLNIDAANSARNGNKKKCDAVQSSSKKQSTSAGNSSSFDARDEQEAIRRIAANLLADFEAAQRTPSTTAKSSHPLLPRIKEEPVDDLPIIDPHDVLSVVCGNSTALTKSELLDDIDLLPQVTFDFK